MSLGSFQRRTLSILQDLQTRSRRYESLSESGVPIANSLVNARLQEGYAEHKSYWPSGIARMMTARNSDGRHPLPDSEDGELSFLGIGGRYRDYWFEECAGSVAELRRIVEKMEAQVERMRSRFEDLTETLCAEARDSFSAEFAAKTPISRTATFPKLCSRAEEFVEMHEADLKLKCRILQSLPLLASTERQDAVVLLSAWMHNIEVDADRLREFEDFVEAEFSVDPE